MLYPLAEGSSGLVNEDKKQIIDIFLHLKHGTSLDFQKCPKASSPGRKSDQQNKLTPLDNQSRTCWVRLFFTIKRRHPFGCRLILYLV